MPFTTLEKYPLFAVSPTSEQSGELSLKQRVKRVGDPKNCSTIATIECIQTCSI